MTGTIISFLNMKGGVGKTALCKEIGYSLAKDGYKVLFIDVDPQSNLTQSVFSKHGYMSTSLYEELPESEKEKDKRRRKHKIKTTSKSISQLFVDSARQPKPDEVILKLPMYHIIPGELTTIFIENTLGGAGKENALDNYILNNKLSNFYDYILIDCPPTYSYYTTAALNASDYYIVPVGVDAYSILGISLLEEVVEKVKLTDARKYQTKTLRNMGIIFNPFNFFKEERASSIINSIKSNVKLKKYNLYFFDEVFEYNNALKKKANYFILDYNNTKNLANLSNLTEEFKQRIKILEGE